MTSRRLRVTYAVLSFGEMGPMRPPYMVCKGFAELGWEVDILTVITSENQSVTNAWGTVPVNSIVSKKRKVGILKLGWRLLVRRRDHIVINTIWDFHCFALLLAKLLFGSPYIIRLDTYTHGHHSHGTSIGSRLWHDIRYGLLIRYADAVLAETPTIVCHTLQNVPGARVLQIPPSLWLHDLRKIEEKWELEQYEPMRSDTILYVGRIIERKNVHDLISAFMMLSETFPNWTLEIRGPVASPVYFESLIALVRSKGLGEIVTFGGALYGEELYRRYRATSIYCLPSKGEGMPGTILEAMYFGGAIVAGESGYVAYQLNWGECGLLHEPGDVLMLKRQLSQLMASGETRKALMAHARRRMVELFSWESYLEVFKDSLLSFAQPSNNLY